MTTSTGADGRTGRGGTDDPGTGEEGTDGQRTGDGPGAPGSGRPTIWVADDEPDILDLYREILEGAGYDVECAGDGPTLLDRVGDDVPDLVLLDINMPGMNGWEVRRQLREDPRTEGVPVIAVTAVSDGASQASAVRTFEFADFVTKPFHVQPFLDTVEAVLGRTRKARDGGSGGRPAPGDADEAAGGDAGEAGGDDAEGPSGPGRTAAPPEEETG